MKLILFGEDETNKSVVYISIPKDFIFNEKKYILNN